MRQNKKPKLSMESSSNVIRMPGIREIPNRAPRSVKSTTEAVILTQEAIAQWKAPPFQRPLRVNAKVTELAEAMKTGGGILPGILTIGVFEREKFLVDGQHRIEAFKISGLAEVYAEIRICHFDSMADMADEFVTLNSKLVTMRPDDILRGLEASSPEMIKVREECEFVGYDFVRRGATAPMVSMSVVVRCWFGSAQETPRSGGTSVSNMIKILTPDETDKMIQYLKIAHDAWGRDVEYQRLWGALNLTMTMWLWRRLVMEKYSAKSIVLTVPQFRNCMMSLSTSNDYLDWLVGRNLGERDRSPAYTRVRNIFVKRIFSDLGKKAIMPSSPWYQNKSR